MTFTLLFLIGSLCVGQLGTSYLPMSWYKGEVWAARTVFGLLCSTWLLLFSVWLFGYPLGTAITLALQVIAAGIVFNQRQRIPTFLSFTTVRQKNLWRITTGLLSALIVFLLYRHMLNPGVDGAYSGGPSLGDIPLHLSLITNTAYQSHFNWSFSLFAGTKLTYPFLIDFLGGVFVRYGASLQMALLVPSIALMLSLVQLIFFLTYRITTSVRASAISTVFLFFSGSSFGFCLAFYDFYISKLPFVRYFSHLQYDYSNVSFFGFGNSINTILMPQRSFQFGLSVFCLICIISHEAFKQKSDRESMPLFITLSLLLGLLPFAHTHTFFVALGAIATFTLLAIFQKQSYKPWALALIGGIALAAPQILFQLKANFHPGLIYYHLGWMLGNYPNSTLWIKLIGYIWLNFGIVVCLGALAFLSRTLSYTVRGLMLLGAFLFTISNIFIFQPAPYDNIKFLIYAYFLFSLGIAQYITQLTRLKAWRLLGCVFIVLMTATGAVAILFEAQQHVLFYSTNDFKLADDFRRVLPLDAVVLSSDTNRHPLWSLAGQPVVRGYHYWLWSYGLPLDSVSADVYAMYAGSENTPQLLKKYNVSYILIGPSERDIFSPNEDYFRRNFPLYTRIGSNDIYAVSPSLSKR